MRKTGTILVAIAVGLVLYQNSPVSIYFWGPALDFLVRFLYAPYSLAPYRFYNPGCSGGFICVQDPLPAIFLLILSLAWTFLIGAAIYWVLQRVPPRLRLVSQFVGVAVFLAIGYVSAQVHCVRSYEAGIDPFYPYGETITPQTYGDKGWPQGTGLVSFSFSSNQIPDAATTWWFLEFNGLQRIKGSAATGILAMVPPGQEFARLCQIKTYSQINPYVEPISEKDLSSGGLAPYLDSAFCGSHPSYCISSSTDQ